MGISVYQSVMYSLHRQIVVEPFGARIGIVGVLAVEMIISAKRKGVLEVVETRLYEPYIHGEVLEMGSSYDRRPAVINEAVGGCAFYNRMVAVENCVGEEVPRAGTIVKVEHIHSRDLPPHIHLSPIRKRKAIEEIPLGNDFQHRLRVAAIACAGRHLKLHGLDIVGLQANEFIIIAQRTSVNIDFRYTLTYNANVFVIYLYHGELAKHVDTGAEGLQRRASNRGDEGCAMEFGNGIIISYNNFLKLMNQRVFGFLCLDTDGCAGT